MNSKADLAILRSLREAIATIKSHPLSHVETEICEFESRLSKGDENASREFWRFINENEFGIHVVDSVTDLALEFVSGEIKRIGEIKQTRKLTPEEKQAAKSALGGVLDSLKSFVDSDEDDTNGDQHKPNSQD